MTKKAPVQATRLPKIEPAFIEALEEIAQIEHLSLERLLAIIRKQPGASLAAKARLYALTYYRDHAQPTGFSEAPARSPLEIALQQVRQHRPKKTRKS